MRSNWMIYRLILSSCGFIGHFYLTHFLFPIDWMTDWLIILWKLTSLNPDTFSDSILLQRVVFIRFIRPFFCLFVCLIEWFLCVFVITHTHTSEKDHFHSLSEEETVLVLLLWRLSLITLVVSLDSHSTESTSVRASSRLFPPFPCRHLTHSSVCSFVRSFELMPPHPTHHPTQLGIIFDIFLYFGFQTVEFHSFISKFPLFSSRNQLSAWPSCPSKWKVDK